MCRVDFNLCINHKHEFLINVKWEDVITVTSELQEWTSVQKNLKIIE